MIRRLPFLVAAALLGGCSVFGVRSGYEQTDYQVVETLAGGVEIRRYEPRLAAETRVAAFEPGAARGDAFRILAAYIFGANREAGEIAMTTPVEVGDASVEISMTAPVEAAEAGDTLLMRFFMPARFTRETLPEPTDARVRIVTVPGETVAALRFSGLARTTAIEARETELLEALASSPWREAGEPRALFYDPPFALPFLRRNEVVVRVSQ